MSSLLSLPEDADFVFQYEDYELIKIRSIDAFNSLKGDDRVNFSDDELLENIVSDGLYLLYEGGAKYVYLLFKSALLYRTNGEPIGGGEKYDILNIMSCNGVDVWSSMPELIYYYSRDILKQRFIDKEMILINYPFLALLYAIYIINDRWAEAELTLKNTEFWPEYCKAFNIVESI